MARSGWRMVACAHGGPEVIAREDFAPPDPGPGELLIETEAVGLNFIDIYHRAGLYPVAPPVPLGGESVGRVIAVGAEVAEVAPGDRVGCAGTLGAYATHRVVPAARAVRIPDDIAPDIAAAVLLKGMTAALLADHASAPRAGETVLVHAAAGGVGAILVPWLRHRRVRVIAHVGNAAKAREVDAEHVLSEPFATLAETARALTGGAGVTVVYDGVGQASWAASFGALARRGLLVSFGNASGPVPPISPLELMRAGSVYLTRPTLFDYSATRAELTALAEALFARVRGGVVRARIGARYPLAEAAAAQRALEARETTGSTILIP